MSPFLVNWSNQIVGDLYKSAFNNVNPSQALLDQTNQAATMITACDVINFKKNFSNCILNSFCNYNASQRNTLARWSASNEGVFPSLMNLISAIKIATDEERKINSDSRLFTNLDAIEHSLFDQMYKNS